MTHEDYVSFEQAKALKDLGFDWDVSHCYWTNVHKDPQPHGYAAEQSEDVPLTEFYWNDNNHPKLISAPTLSQAQKWLREKGFHIQITPNITWRGWRILLYIKKGSPEIYDSYEGYKFDSYEKALLSGINRVLEILKQEKK